MECPDEKTRELHHESHGINVGWFFLCVCLFGAVDDVAVIAIVFSEYFILSKFCLFRTRSSSLIPSEYFTLLLLFSSAESINLSQKCGRPTRARELAKSSRQKSVLFVYCHFNILLWMLKSWVGSFVARKP